jgi:hypothetical protein
MKLKNWMISAIACAMPLMGMAQANAQRFSDGFGVTEWEAWGFAQKDFWISADDQDRSNWFGGSGMVAVADPDEWDDLNTTGLSGSPDNYGTLNSQMKTPGIDVAAYAGQTGKLSFNSTWRPEFDDYANQSASVEAIFDGGTVVELLRWNSNTNDTDPGEDDSVDANGRRQNTLGVGHGKDASGRPEAVEGVIQPPNNPAVDELVERDVEIPAGASSVMFAFNFFDGTNDWWWAVDNIAFGVGSNSLFFEDFESLAEAAKPINGGGAIDETKWLSRFDEDGSGDLDFFEEAVLMETSAYTQNPPAGWSLTPDYTGPAGSWANNNGQTVSAPGINIPEPTAACLLALSLAGLAVGRRR